jgi:Na+-translocating ferredoxin:NAD+ oxidoreductase RnfG subunit
MIRYYLILAIIGSFTSSFLVPDRVEKKANKEIIKHFNIKEFDKETISIPETINSSTASEFGDENLFRIISDDVLMGYGYIGSAEANVSTFDYLVLFDTDLIIIKTKVLIYREEYGGEISSKRWLKQFIGVSSSASELIYKKDIVPISGATISVRSMTRAINDLLKSINFLQEQELL